MPVFHKEKRSTLYDGREEGSSEPSKAPKRPIKQGHLRVVSTSSGVSETSIVAFEP